ncbi:MAG: trimeric autotransporter adhesin [Candidatus Sumerlaeota bacterium]|nr:trimeric autotransporter adhesin [Candidatus Sumerlaeota bacterium]
MGPSPRTYFQAKMLISLGFGLAASSAAFALNPMASASFTINRTSTNSGSAVQVSSGGSYRVAPQVVGGPISGASSSARFRANEGRLGASVLPGDDVYVDPLWVAQGDVDADPTVGLAGCAPPIFPLIFGVNAFQDIPTAVSATNTSGRVHLLNGDHLSENVALTKRITILGEDESVGTCTGQVGRTGARVVPPTGYAVGKTHFAVQAPGVTIRDLTLIGDNTGIPGSSEAGSGIEISDATGTVNDLTVDNAWILNFREFGIKIDAPGTTGHLINNCGIINIADYTPGGPAGSALRFGAASGTVQGGAVLRATTGVEVYGGAAAAPGLAAGTGIVPVVAVDGMSFEDTGQSGNAGRGALAFLDNASGSATNCQFTDNVTAIQVARIENESTITLDSNQFNGTMETAIDISDVYAPVAAPNPARVDVLNNSFASPIEVAAVAVRRVGRDAAGSRNTGAVRINGNMVTSLAGSASDPTGVFLHAIDPAFGSVEVAGNVIDALSRSLSLAGIHLDTRDVLGTPGLEVASSNVTLDGNTVSDWNTGVLVTNSGAGGAATLAAVLGAVAPNTVEGCLTGVRIGPDSTLDAGNALLAAQDIRNNDTGVIAAGTAARANLVNNALTGNDMAAVTVNSGASVMMEGNLVETAASAGSRGVEVVAAGATVDLGGGAFGSTGSNTFNVTQADGWALVLDAAATAMGEDNTWQYQGVTYNGSKAVDDLIRDGDADNAAAGGEAGTFGPFDFIPFTAGSLAAAVSLDATYERGTTAGYGVTAVRSLADAVEASATLGTATAEAGTYVAMRYGADGAYDQQGIDFMRPLTIAAATPGTAVILPGADGPGTAVDTVQEAGSLTLLRVLSDDIVLSGLVLDGDNPSVPGTVTVNGADINARNAVVIDGGTGGGGPDSLAFTDLEVRNFFYNGIIVEDVPGNKLDDLTITGGTFTNIDGFQTATARSTALSIAESRRTILSGNTFDEVQAAIDFRAQDNSSIHTVSGNMVTNAAVRGIAAGSVSGTALIRLTGNTVTGGDVAVEVSDVATSGMVEARANIIDAATEGMRIRQVDGVSLVAAVGNTFTASGGSVGLATHQTATSGAGFGVLVETNAFDGYTSGVLVAADHGGLGPQDNTGTVIARNTFANNGTGVQIEGTSGNTTYAMVGGADPTFRNGFTANTVGVSVAGTGATADVRNNFIPNVFPFTGEAFDGHDFAISIENGAKANVVGNEIVNSALAAIRVTGTGTEALVETNEASGALNQVGILVADNALASMGPGTAPTITDPFFAAATSTGLNKLRGYTGAAGNYAIENTSVADQNAENNDFNTLDLVAIEGFVQHQPDNSQGQVFYDPPSNQFTGIEDWKTLQQD